MSIHAPLDFQGVKYTPNTPTLDKTMHDRNRLTAAEIDKLMAAAARPATTVALARELVPARVMPKASRMTTLRIC